MITLEVHLGQTFGCSVCPIMSSTLFTYSNVTNALDFKITKASLFHGLVVVKTRAADKTSTRPNCIWRSGAWGVTRLRHR